MIARLIAWLHRPIWPLPSPPPSPDPLDPNNRL